MRRARARGVGVRRVAGEQEGLAAAAAEVLLLLVATAAGRAHPFVATEFLEGGRLVPQPGEALVAHRGEFQPLDHARLLAGHGDAVRGDGEVDRAPAVHARLGAALVVVGDDEVDRHAIAEALARRLHRALGGLQLLECRQQLVAIDHRPVVVLDVGELEVIDADVLGEREDVLDLADVVPEHRHVEHHRKAVGLDQVRHLHLEVEGARADQGVGEFALARLQRELDLVEAGGLERDQALFAQADAGGDQVGVVAERAGVGDEFFQVVAQQRLAAGEAELQRAELAAFAQHALPFGGGQFGLAVAGVVDRVAAPRALQRAAVGELEHQPQRLALPVKPDDGSILWHGTPPGICTRPRRRARRHPDSVAAVRPPARRRCACRRSAR